MAQKRMFDLSIIDQDKFIDLPVSSRLLYYELGMRADDDGFIAPQKIIRMLGLSQDDLKILIVKNFVLQFPDGVVVITNWKNNNLIRNDRYKPTLYQGHLKSLTIEDDHSYTFGIPDDNQVVTNSELGNGEKEVEESQLSLFSNSSQAGIPNDNQMTAQYSIVKSRVEKNRVEESSIESEILEEQDFELKLIVDFYNQVFDKRIESTISFADNFKFWRKTHSIEKIKLAIESARSDRFWQDKLTLTKLFRRKNPQGEKVDQIEELSNRTQSTGGVAFL